MRKIVCDAGSLISLSDNCLLGILPKLDAEFVIPLGVQKEIVTYPVRTKRFMLKAIQLDEILEKGIVKLIEDKQILEYGKYIIGLANSLLSYKDKNIKIVQEGEAESIGCLKFLKETTLLIDERTTRHLVENPAKLKQHMEHVTKYRLKMDDSVLEELQKELKDIEIIRSAELVSFAYEKGFLPETRVGNILEAALYGVKYAGCSITREEIDEYLKMLG